MSVVCNSSQEMLEVKVALFSVLLKVETRKTFYFSQNWISGLLIRMSGEKDDVSPLEAAVQDLSVQNKSAAAAKATSPADNASGKTTSETIFKAAAALDVNSMTSVQELTNYIRLQQFGKLQAEADERVCALGEVGKKCVLHAVLKLCG